MTYSILMTEHTLIFKYSDDTQHLFLFDSNSNQWIQQTVGYLELWQNVSTKNVKLVMYNLDRSVLYLNHYIIPELIIKKESNNLTWYGFQYPNNSLKKFKISFNSDKITNLFYQLYEKYRAKSI